MKRTLRNASTLSESLQRHLNTYALAASAAGVGALALALPAEAKIVYTKANFKIVAHDQQGLTLNNEGNADFLITCDTFSGNGRESSYLYTKGINAKGNNVVVQFRGSDNLGAAALKAGKTIGPHDPFSSFARMAAVSPFGTYIFGLWANHGKGIKNRYLGFEFKISGQTRYGWARLSVKVIPRNLTAYLTGYAYETIPNKPIIAGKTTGPDVITLEPGSLGALAAGASRLHKAGK